MANGQIANCARCNRVFRKTLTDKCPECVEAEYQQFQMMFRLLQNSAEHGGLFIDDLAEKVGVSVEYIEQYYLDSKLGTAGMFLKFKCRSCGGVMAEMNRKGRYCINCSETVSAQAGVEVKSRNRLNRESDETRLITITETAPARPAAPAPMAMGERRSGFLRNH